MNFSTNILWVVYPEGNCSFYISRQVPGEVNIKKKLNKGRDFTSVFVPYTQEDAVKGFA